jgi:hypothetical protein
MKEGEGGKEGWLGRGRSGHGIGCVGPMRGAA